MFILLLIVDTLPNRLSSNLLLAFFFKIVYYNPDRDFLALVSANISIYMTEISKQRPTLVLMAGFGGSGKTTLAYKLAEQLGWLVLDKDIFKTEIIRTVASIPESISISEKTASKLAYGLLFALARDIVIYQRISVILDTPASFPEVTHFARQLMHTTDMRLKAILCKADKDTRSQRLQQRNEQDAGRRQLLVDQTAGEDNWWRFDHLPMECLLEIDTTRPLEEYLQLALQHLSDNSTTP